MKTSRQHDSESEPRLRKTFSLRKSVFWRAASVLIGLQIVTALIALGLAGWFARSQSLDLAANSIRLRLDGIAEEVEARADLSERPVEMGELLTYDVASRFADPVFLLSPDGTLRSELPVENPGAATPSGPLAADTLRYYLGTGEVIVRLDLPLETQSWGLVPLYDRDDFLAGGILVRPLAGSVESELYETRAAFQRALYATLALAVMLALVFGALITWWLVRPLRRITTQVETIERGDYTARVPVHGTTELGRLGQSVNSMAGAVEKSVQSLVTTDRLRRELVANVGHDLRTPLTAMTGYIEEATRHLANGELQRSSEALATAEKQADRLRILIEDLFELSLLETVPPPLNMEPVPLSELLTDAFQAHESGFLKKNVALYLEMSETLPVVSADGARLLRAIDNLLENGLRHTPSGGTVILRGVEERGRIVVEVEDSGPGMNEATSSRVFERHYTGDPARTRSGKGAGLGLPIALAIVEAHGGSLTVRSAPGEGSTFRAELPV